MLKSRYEKRNRGALTRPSKWCPDVSINAVGDAHDIEAILSVDSTAEYQSRLKLILTATQGSLEALDRLCMVICPDANTWAKRCNSPIATQAIAEFLADPAGTETIPWYIAERFTLPFDWLGRMPSNLAAEIHNSLQSLYGTSYGLALERDIASIVEQDGYTWEKGAAWLVDEKRG